MTENEGGRSAGADSNRDDIADAYERIADGEVMPKDDPKVAFLMDRGFVVDDPETPESLVAVDPLRVVSQMLSEQSAQLAAAASCLADLPPWARELLPVFYGTRFRSSDGCEFLPTPAAVNDRIGAAVAGAKEELFTSQPGGPRRRKVLKMGTERDTAALRRGVRMLTLYHSSSHADPVTRTYASELIKEGAEIRTLDGEFLRLIVVDRREAFISNHLVEDAEPHSGVHVTDLAMVAFIRAVFLAFWHWGKAWGLEGKPVAEGDLDEGHRQVLQGLGEGWTHERIARGLGVSARTVRRRLALLYEVSGAENDYQLGQWAARMCA